MSRIQPVILSGGSGTRLWPASRATYPKQLLRLTGDRSLLQDTALRLRGMANLATECLIVCNEAHRFLVAEQMREIDVPARIVLEPEGRNTAPAVALAALLVAETAPETLLLVMPADHIIEDTEAFQKAIADGAESAAEGRLLTFGIVPDRPETGYGYILARPEGNNPVVVQSFVEKPDAAAARAYVDGGEYFWNSGMFLFTARAYLDSLGRLAPRIQESCAGSVKARTEGHDFIRPDASLFAGCPGDSIDYAVMEKTADAVMVPLDAGWSDVGSWTALRDLLPGDEDGNSTEGDVLLQDCRNTLVKAESRLVAAVGLENMIVVETKDATLVMDGKKSQQLKNLVDQLKAESREEARFHRQVFRPWGSYDGVDAADGFQVKRLIVSPGAVLSLQKHAHRAEHWVVVRGKARITRNEDVFDLCVNESTYIGIGDVHRIANPFREPVHIIEVQCGDYLGEDDIVRIEDEYGREGTNT
jgi:mannose-1-phosphate guanylyltransferase/mannose-6-phosphate isomerase